MFQKTLLLDGKMADVLHKQGIYQKSFLFLDILSFRPIKFQRPQKNKCTALISKTIYNDGKGVIE